MGRESHRVAPKSLHPPYYYRKDEYTPLAIPDPKYPPSLLHCPHLPHTLSPHLPHCLSMSSILVWKTGSTASTLTPVPDWGMANTSTT